MGSIIFAKLKEFLIKRIIVGYYGKITIEIVDGKIMRVVEERSYKEV